MMLWLGTELCWYHSLAAFGSLIVELSQCNSARLTCLCGATAVSQGQRYQALFGLYLLRMLLLRPVSALLNVVP